MAVRKSRKHIKNSAFTAEQLKGMESSKLGVWKRYYLSIEGIRKKGTFLSKMVYTLQGSKLTLANSHNTSDFDNLRVRKISISKRLRVRIIHVSQVKGENLLVVSSVG